MAKAKKVLAWTDEEIVKSYQGALFPARQIGVLAELNNCEQDDIRAVLRRNGIKLRRHKSKKMQTTDWAKLRRAEGFPPNCRVVLDDGTRYYTMSEVAQRHGKSKSYMTLHTRGFDACTIDGVTYTVRRAEAICGRREDPKTKRSG